MGVDGIGSKGGRFRFFLQGVHQLLWPAVCLGCRENIAEGDNGLCKSCWGELLACSGGDYCPRCGRDVSRYGLVAGACPDCQGKELCFDGIARGGVYTQSLRQMILAFKNGRAELDKIVCWLAKSAFQGSSFYNEVEVIIPVPLHWRRRLVRGYNQSLILAKRLGRPGVKISTDLVRARHTKSQPAMVSFAARKRNVAGAFAVRRDHQFRGRVVCLVDDIKTSGATLNECARVLKEAGAGKVFAVVAAVAGQ